MQFRFTEATLVCKMKVSACKINHIPLLVVECTTRYLIHLLHTLRFLVCNTIPIRSSARFRKLCHALSTYGMRLCLLVINSE